MQTAVILLYGYNSDDAFLIKSFTDRTLGFPVPMKSASQRRDEKICDLLKGTQDDLFADETTKILMLVGFSKEQMNAFLANFPSGEGGLQRPIFCTLTEQNQIWPFEELIEHLEEEHRYWAEKKSQMALTKQESMRK